MNTAPAPPAAAAPAPIANNIVTKNLTLEQIQRILSGDDSPLANDFDLCQKVRKETSLTPPFIIDALCEGEPIWVCIEAIYVEEVLEIARTLNRGHLLRFVVDC